MPDTKVLLNRCFGSGKLFYEQYHDNEWGIPVYDDRLLFEMLILEGAHAGLSWEIVLKKRQEYKKCFYNFDVNKVANMTDQQLEDLLTNPGLIRNRLKIYSARKNALAYIQIQKEFGSFSNYLWAYVDNKQINNNFSKPEDMPTSTDLSDKLSKDLKKRGMSFVGTTIIYSYLQAVGVIDDHLTTCHCYKK
jgi:DNA-3-methyladenine glycosylase I